jgi:hypothetical protein
MDAFNVLDIRSKSALLYSHGYLVETISYFHYRVNLYSFDRMFIEEFYDTETKGITRISVAEDRDLRKYLLQIDISELDQML